MNSRDGRELKIYVETSCCEGVKGKDFAVKYSQFQVYDHQIISTTVARIKAQVRKAKKENGDKKMDVSLLY